MAKLVDIWRGDNPADLKRRQMPLVVDENLTMIMDVSNLGAICESPLVRGKQLDDFSRKFDTLANEEVRSSFQVTCKDLLSILGQSVPCVGCRRSVEKLFYDLMRAAHPVLDPLLFTPEGLLTVKEEVLQSPQMLCTILHKHSSRLSSIVEKQTRSKKSHRCALHSLEVQRMRPPPSAWREVWECMKQPCRQEITLIESDVLDSTLETYLRKHRFCSECRTKVLLASSLLTSESEPTKEKGYVASLYAGIKRCPAENHVHLPTNTEYINAIISRAQPEVIGRERHAKTLEMAQEEVVTCLGICVADRLHRMHRRLKEAEMICKVLAAVAVEALSRNFEMAVEAKQGVTKLELLYEELTRKEVAKQQRQEKLRIKRKMKRERRYEAEIEEKENKCDCSSEKSSSNSQDSCSCSELKPVAQNIDRNKLQVLDPKNKGPPTCKCLDCIKKATSLEETPQTPKKSVPNIKKSAQKDVSKKKDFSKNKKESKVETRKSSSKETSEILMAKKNLESKEIPLLEAANGDEKDIKVSPQGSESPEWSLHDNTVADLTNVWLDRPNNMWTEMKEHMIAKLTDRNCRSSSEHSSRDRGYSSEHYVSSGSFPCTPEGSDVACSDGFCNHEENCSKSLDKPGLFNSNTLRINRCEGPTLMQMLEDSNSEDEEMESYIPMEEVIEFQSRKSQILEKRQELRERLKSSFEMMCSHSKPFIPH